MGWAENNKNYFLGAQEMKINATPKSQVFSPARENHPGLFAKINFFFRKEKRKEGEELEFYRNLAKKDAENPRIHLKLAEIYHKTQEKRKATSEYLKAAEIFLKNGLLPQALALYKKVLKENPYLKEVNWKVAEVYRQMGFLGEAFRQYNYLLRQYELMGRKEKAQEIMELMVNLDPQKFMINFEKKEKSWSAADSLRSEYAGKETLLAEEKDSFFDLNAALEKRETLEIKNIPEVEMNKEFGFRQVIAELRKNASEKKIYPNFYYHLGVACWEMGFIDEAIENLQEALKNGESILAAAKLMSRCYKEKGWWEEARESLRKALLAEEISPEEKEKLRKEMELIENELVREKQILGILNTNFSNKTEATKKKGTLTFGERGLKIVEAASA